MQQPLKSASISKHLWLFPQPTTAPLPALQPLHSLPDLLSLPESLQNTSGNRKQARDTAGWGEEP